MRTRHLVGGLLAAALLSSGAIAQTAAPAPAPSAAATTTVTKSNQWRSSKLIGVNVYNEQNDKLGAISEIILDPTGKVTGYVVGVGGFLGMGEHDILVEPSKIKFVNEPMRSTATKTDKKVTDAAPTNTRPVSNTSAATQSANEQWYPDHGILNATKDQLKSMPQFKYSSAK